MDNSWYTQAYPRTTSLHLVFTDIILILKCYHYAIILKSSCKSHYMIWVVLIHGASDYRQNGKESQILSCLLTGLKPTRSLTPVMQKILTYSAIELSKTCHVSAVIFSNWHLYNNRDKQYYHDFEQWLSLGINLGHTQKLRHRVICLDGYPV